MFACAQIFIREVSHALMALALNCATRLWRL